VSLQFNPATHQYSWGGRIVPSVTQILRPLFDFSGIDPEVLAAAADRGNRVHKATELFDQGRLDTLDLGDMGPYVWAYKQWHLEMSPVILEAEKQVYCGQHNFAGTLDRVASVYGEEWLVDIKTSDAIPASVGPQTAAYERALSWGSPLKRAVLQLKGDGTYRWRELSSPGDWPVFLSCLVIHNFKGRPNV
jgi:hypothetical protein